MDIRAITAELEAIGAELRRPSTLPFPAAEIRDVVRQIENGYVIECEGKRDMYGRAHMWRYTDALPVGYGGHYYEAGKPYSLRVAQGDADRSHADSVYEDWKRGGTLN